MSITRVGTTQIQGSGTAVAGGSNTAGNLLVLTGRLVGSTATPTITDTLGNTWVVAVQKTNGVSSLLVAYVSNCLGGSNTSVSVGVSGAYCLQQYNTSVNGPIVVGATAVSGVTTSTAYTCGPVSPVTANNLIVASLENETANGLSLSAIGGGFAQQGAANGNNFLLDLIQASATAATATATISSSVAWAGAIVAFNETAGGSSISGNAGVASAVESYFGTRTGSVVADGSGNYSIPSLVDGSYTVIPALSGYYFTPLSRAVTIAGGSQSGVNFTATSASILPTPTFSPVAGTYTSTQSVTITSSGASTIYYTTDGSTPTILSTLYTGPVSVLASETINAIASAPTSAPSAVGSAAYVISTINRSGLIAEYQCLPTETPAALVDYSGNGNNATGTVGTAPTIIAGTGGVNFTAVGAVSLPAALNSAATIMIYMTASQKDQNTGLPMIIGGNGASNVGVCLSYNGTNNDQVLIQNTSGSSLTNAIFNGTGSLAFVMGTGGTKDAIYINANTTANAQAGATSQGVQASGNYQLGGVSGTYRYCTAKVYYVAIYNRALSSGEVASNYTAMAATMAARGVTAGLGFISTDTGNNLILDGDSLAAFLGSYPMTTPASPAYLTWDIGFPGLQLVANSSNFAGHTGPMYNAFVARNLSFNWAGTNDLSGGATAAVTYANMKAYCVAARAQGWKVIASTCMDRSTITTTVKNSYNTLIRAGYLSGDISADGLFDIAAQPLLGADGASANATIFPDGTHPAAGPFQNLVSPLAQRSINRVFGNLSFGSGNTYTTTAPAPTAITACTEATQTMTFTCALNPPVGSMVTVAGVTPAGYNGQWKVLTTSAPSFTAFNTTTTGLGAGSVFGTAAIPVMVDLDVFITLAGSASTPNFTLQSSIGLTNQVIYIRNTSGTSTWTITPYGSETIDGSASITMAPNTGRTFTSTLVSAAAGGNNWVSANGVPSNSGGWMQRHRNFVNKR